MTVGCAAPTGGGEMPRTPPVDDGEAPVAAAVQGAASTRNPLSVGFPIEEPLVGNWSRVRQLLEGWGQKVKTGSCGIIPL